MELTSLAYRFDTWACDRLICPGRHLLAANEPHAATKFFDVDHVVSYDVSPSSTTIHCDSNYLTVQQALKMATDVVFVNFPATPNARKALPFIMRDGSEHYMPQSRVTPACRYWRGHKSIFITHFKWQVGQDHFSVGARCDLVPVSQISYPGWM